MNFLSFLDVAFAPPRFSCAANNSTSTFSPNFLSFERQDQAIVAWLLSSISPSLLTNMVGLYSSHQIWSNLQTHYASKTRACVKKLHMLLRTPKRERSISVYLQDIKKSIDSLAAVGSPISIEEHIELILDGLHEECNAFITSVISRTHPYTIEEVEALLLGRTGRKISHQQRSSLSS